MTWAYHATDAKRLPAIVKGGLIPQSQPHEHMDEERDIDEPATFFSPRPGLAKLWGNTILRYPWPEDAREDPYGESFIDKDGSINYTNWYTETAVSPEELQVYDGTWRALLSASQPVRNAPSPREVRVRGRRPEVHVRVRGHRRQSAW